MSSYLILREHLGKGRFDFDKPKLIAIAYHLGGGNQHFYIGDRDKARELEDKGVRVEWIDNS